MRWMAACVCTAALNLVWAGAWRRQVVFEGARDRRQIKNKFKREERENPTSVDQALITQYRE